VAGTAVGAVVLLGFGLSGNGYLASNPAIATVAASQHYTSSTTTTLVSNRNPSRVGQFVTPIATVVATDGPVRGTVDFMDGTATICDDVAVDGQGIATCAVKLSADVHLLTAIFTGNADFGPSASLPLAQTVLRA
jgi:hypothetical protein